jgi:hypothetical protein
MFGGMLVFRLVTAANMATGQANTQVHPTVPSFETFFASVGGASASQYFIEVLTINAHLRIRLES